MLFKKLKIQVTEIPIIVWIKLIADPIAGFLTSRFSYYQCVIQFCWALQLRPYKLQDEKTSYLAEMGPLWIYSLVFSTSL